MKKKPAKQRPATANKPQPTNDIEPATADRRGPWTGHCGLAISFYKEFLINRGTVPPIRMYNIENTNLSLLTVLNASEVNQP